MLKTFSALVVVAVATLMAQAQLALVSFDPTAKVFRLDGGNASYVFGVNPRGELQQLYWGGRLGSTDAFAQAAPAPEWASFDSSYSNTPQEFAGWGAGLFMEPALKVSFVDGNRDLVLHYDSHTMHRKWPRCASQGHQTQDRCHVALLDGSGDRNSGAVGDH